MGKSYSKSNREHGFIAMSKALKSDSIGNPILLCGNETYLIHWARDQIIDKYINPVTKMMDLAIIDQENSTVETIIEACETMAMMSTKKIVVVRNLPFIYGSETKYWSKKEIDRLSKYMESISNNLILIFLSTREEKDNRQGKTAFFKTLEAKGTIYEFSSLNREDLGKFIKKRVSASGKSISRQAMDLLIYESGYFNEEIDYGLYNLENDIKKLTALVQAQEITEKEVLDSISQNLEHNVFKLLDSISNQRKEEAFRLFHQLTTSGANHFQLLSAIISQIEIMLMVKEMRGEGFSLGEMTKALGVHQYRLQKALSFGEHHQLENIRNMLKLSLLVESRIKSGLLDGDMAMEMMIAEM